jgi:hypothetical protein
MQHLQLGIFVAAMIALVVCGLYPHAETDKKTNGNFAASGAGRTSPRLFRSRRRKGQRGEGTAH